MRRAEWGALAMIVRHAYPGQFTEDEEDAYFFLLRTLPSEDVRNALETYANTGNKFRPSAPELGALARGVHQPLIATPDEAWALIQRAIGKIRGGIGDPEFPERHQAAIDWIAEQDRVVAAYAARRRLRGPGSLGAEKVEDAQFGGAAVKRLRDEYREWIVQVESRVARGLPPVEDRMLLINGGSRPGGMAQLVDGLRPAKELPAGDGPEEGA